jgi:BirA family transcriptional regulator, biotin operon repressor / biotin---[acetyl-CoA-carboxylase] ligase
VATREVILEILKARQNEWTSGEELSVQLKMSRAAVWKHIARLRQDGYEIEASTRKGYQLRNAPSLLLPAEIRDGLKTSVWGKRDIVYHPETPSTNTDAKVLATQGAPEGTIVIAEHQTMGRGRLGRTWYSPRSHGIYISFIIRPRLSLQDAPILTPLAAVAAAEALALETGLRVHLKWPNDIMVSGKKIGGILTEIGSEMDRVDFAVVGVGLNARIWGFPEDLEGKATSIALETSRQFSRSSLVRGCLGKLETVYEQQKRWGFGSLLTRYKALTAIVGKEAILDSGERRFAGRVRDLDEHGALLVEDGDGKTVRVVSGDIHYHFEGMAHP